MEQWRTAFIVAVQGNETPLLGTYRVEESALIFEPRFPVQPGVKYEASFHADPPARRTFEIAAGQRTPPKVVAVYPSSGHLPENQLKMYAHFSAPMSRGSAYQRIRLLDEGGAPVELPFLEIEQELWDPAGRRLTILFDPGRIKRGLLPHQDVGPPLHPGHRYTLVIEPGWPDATGTPSVSVFRKEFAVVDADREPPDPSRWKIRQPQAGTVTPVTVTFPEPMDHALAGALLGIDGVAGKVDLDDQETVWRFTPAQPWRRGTYSLTFDTALEDLAGNRIGRAFDVEATGKPQRKTARQTRRIPFRVK